MVEDRPEGVAHGQCVFSGSGGGLKLQKAGNNRECMALPRRVRREPAGGGGAGGCSLTQGRVSEAPVISECLCSFSLPYLNASFTTYYFTFFFK